MNLSKLISETIDKIVKEDYPVNFKLEEFKTLKSFNKRIEYCQKRLERISSGSSRIVYKIDDEKVLKIARNTFGLKQNEAEIDSSNDYYLDDIMAKVFEYDKDRHEWLEMELATKLTPPIFKSIVGYDWNQYIAFISNYHASHTNRQHYRKMQLDQSISDNMWENEFCYKIVNYIGTYEPPIGDLQKLNSYGVVKRNGENDIVLIDMGLNDDTLDYMLNSKKS